jgi:hypothetical protein
MTYTIGTIRSFHTKNFRVIVDAIEEVDLDLSFDDDGEVQRRLENGTLIAFVARARVIGPMGIELASDYLGGCIYESLEAFADHRECGRQNRTYEANGDTGRCGSYFADMVSSVCSEARKQWKLTAETFSIPLLRN